ncbi:unnamed protein product [Rhizophagus irregularis]|nr:unnamed protein product [Rhizophagus irregularis]
MEGEEFNPTEPYTRRLRKILEEYPDGSQILREILQNSDDAKSTEQVFILDHNTYPSSSLFKPHLNNNCQRGLDSYQGPALLAKNNSLFEERDFKSLLSLANSEKHDQFDKIGVMGVGFNSVYHITDSPSFITDDKYVILDPHKWCYNGGVKFNFINHELAEKCPDQFAPFRRIPCDIPCDELFKKPFKGTIFRYPLRDTTGSDISDKIYNPEDILEMFHKFYEIDSINCLLFLKYIECISFYELEKGANEPKLLYKIQLENAEKVRQERHFIVEKIIPMMDLLNSSSLNENNQLKATYVASFSRQKGDSKEPNSKWLILNYLDDLLETQTYFQNNFRKNIRDYKFIPNVGLAVPLNDLNVTGKLFCFLPLPIPMPFSVSVHGYFAVNTNRRSLWSAADNEDLADNALAHLKVKWNRYLFEKVLPKAWVKFLCELPSNNIQSGDLYKFWPIVKDDSSGNISIFCKDLLQNVVDCLSLEDRVFKGPSSSIIGEISGISADSYNTSSFIESGFHWLSLSNGYLEDEKLLSFDLPKIIGKIGFPVISTSYHIISVLKNSKYKDSLKFFSPGVIRTYLKHNFDKWEGNLPRKEILQLFEYILRDQNFNELEGFKMIPLADNELGTITLSSDSNVYIGPDNNIEDHKFDERHIFENQLNKFIDKSIDFGLYMRLYDNAKAGWNINIKILNESVVADMIRFSLNYSINKKDSEEISIPNNLEWIYRLWNNLRYRNWNLREFEEIHLIPTSNSTIRKLKTPRKIFSNKTSENISTNTLIPIFEKFGAVFVDNQFIEISKWDKTSPYIIKLNDIISVLASLRADTLYPGNLNQSLQIHEAPALVEHLSNYLRIANKDHLTQELIEVIKHLPIFNQVDHTATISLLPGNKEWYLLPQGVEDSYGRIIYPGNKGGFLSTTSRDLCDILEKVIKIPRLNVNDYWRNYVIPFLETQSSENIDIVIDKLFDRLTNIIDVNLKDILGRKSFVLTGTLKMSQQQQKPDNVKLAKPIDLYDPEEEKLINLFFEDERVFPAGNYGISQTSLPNKFLSNLKLLGIKSILSPNDVISRIDAIIDRRQTSNVPEDLIHTKALKLFKYLDENWIKIIDDTQIRGNREQFNAFLKVIIEKEWIPTIDVCEKKIFSNIKKCHSQKDKDLVCLVTPIVDHKLKCKKLLKQLGWDTYPVVGMIIEQLGLCVKGVKNKQPPKNLVKICTAVYKYMDEIFKASDNKYNKEFNYMKNYLKDKPWIFSSHEGQFYPADKVILKLPKKFQKNESLIIELPADYGSFKSLFEAMGVRDEIGIKDFILIINSMVKGNKDKILSPNEINNIIQILEHIASIRKSNRGDGNNPKELDGLLVPTNKNTLADLQEIYFDDMEDRLSEEEKREHIIAHRLVIPYIAKELEIQTLTGKLYGNYNGTSDIDWDTYEQDEKLTTRIKNIIKDYKITSLFKEFLQNADDAGATQFLVVVDERKTNRDNKQKKSLLSVEMADWQGPAIWIYNDAEFSPKDFQALIKLGIGRKACDDTKIGRFGIGFNCAFHVTDLPSFVSGRYIAFLDPNANFLPAQGYPPKRPRGTRIDFIDKEFGKFRDQCYPYEAIFDFIKKTFPDKYKTTESCSFSSEFNGTLFRLPLRNHESKKSEISDQIFEINLYHMKQQATQLVWKTQIYISDSGRKIRKSVIDKAQIYQMGIEIINNMDQSKSSEIWLLCTGGHGRVTKVKLEKFSESEKLKPRGGVAFLLAQSDKSSLNELKAAPFSNLPELEGKIYSFLSLSINTNLGVHLNGNFSLPSARSAILQSENDFLKADSDDAKWNKYILYDVLSDLHIKLLEHIVELDKIRHKKEGIKFIPHTTNRFWPIKNDSTIGLYKDYGLNVIRKLGNGNHKIFWTEANGGQFIPLKDAKIFEEEEAIIADIIKLGIPAVKLSKDKIEHLNKDSFKDLIGLPLVPLSNHSIGKFGEQIYYIGDQEQIELFQKAGPSRFVSIDLQDSLLKIFNADFSETTKIRKFDAYGVLDLLKEELPIVEELDESIPVDSWLEKIWSILIKSAENMDFNKLTISPLLPIIQPSRMLVRLNVTNPPLYDNGHNLIPLLVKLEVRFTNISFQNVQNEKLKKCVLACTPINIINSLERTCTSLYLTMEDLFENSDLSAHDYEDFRTFIKVNLEILLGHCRNQENFMNILCSLPIWPLHSSEDKFIDAKSGKLLPYKLPFFSFDKNTEFYKCDREMDFEVLRILGVTPMSELEYIKKNIIPKFKDFQTPSQKYIDFLQSILSGNQEIEKHLKKYPAIPNGSLTEFVKADALYDITVPLFSYVFKDDDKFLPRIFYSNKVLMAALKRMGLKYQVNCETFIECAQEIEQQSDIQSDRFSMEEVKMMINHLYNKSISNLKFLDDQWKKLINIKFVPSKIIQNPLCEESKETLKFGSFSVLCFQKYKDVCWTKRHFFEKNVEPTDSFCKRDPRIGIPSPKDIIEHWSFVVKNIESIFGQDRSEAKRVIEEIYKIMNKNVEESEELEIDNKEELFLNGDDPLDEKCWVTGSKLAFGIQENTEARDKVVDFLAPYKTLLLRAGAMEVDDNYINEYKRSEKLSQKDKLFKNLLKFINHENKHHDVTFIVGKEEISANRYVLSAASTHFEMVFCDLNKTEIKVEKEKPHTIRVFLRWLYGEEAAINEENFEEGKEYYTDYLTFLVDLLKVADNYDVELLKNEVEDVIISDRRISVHNVNKILNCLKECKAPALKLKECCEKFKEDNSELCR